MSVNGVRNIHVPLVGRGGCVKSITRIHPGNSSALPLVARYRRNHLAEVEYESYEKEKEITYSPIGGSFTHTLRKFLPFAICLRAVMVLIFCRFSQDSYAFGRSPFVRSHLRCHNRRVETGEPCVRETPFSKLYDCGGRGGIRDCRGRICGFVGAITTSQFSGVKSFA